jgi:hypothetical protein
MSAWSRFRYRHEDDLAAGRPTSHPRVERLLDSARAPGTPREVAREDEAVRHFHAAHLDRVHSTRRDVPMSAPSPRAGLKAAFAAAGVVALMSTGVAFAASGHAPWSAASATGRPTTIPSHSHPTDDPSESTDPSEVTDPSEGTDPSEATDTSAADSSSAPDPHAYPGLCRAYAAGQKADQGNSLLSPAFVALVTAAGGPDAVADFCASLVPAHAQPTHPAKPTHPAAPSRPAAPTSHPTAPSHPAAPTHPGPTSHPGGSH